MLSIAHQDEDKSHNFESDNGCHSIYVNHCIRGAYIFSESTNSYKKRALLAVLEIHVIQSCVSTVIATHRLLTPVPVAK